MSKFFFYFCLLLFLLVSVRRPAVADPGKPSKKKVVFIAGRPSHGKGEHEFKGGCTLLARLLNENTSDIDAVVFDSEWPRREAFDGAATVVIYCDGGDAHLIIPHLAEMDSLMKRGVGIVLLHYAVELPKGETGNYFLQWTGGYFETYWSVNPFWNAVFTKLPKHIISRGVKPFAAKDEWYYHMRFREGMKRITPILVSLPPRSTLDRPDGSHDNNPFARADVDKGIPQVMAWATQRPDGGRGFGFTGGHMHNNWMNDDFRKLVLNAIVWTAKGRVPKDGIKTPTPTTAEMNSLLNKAKN